MLGCHLRLGDDDLNEFANLVTVGHDDVCCSKNFVAFLRRQLCELFLREAASAQIDLHLVGHKRTDAGHDVAPVRTAFSCRMMRMISFWYSASARSKENQVSRGISRGLSRRSPSPSVPILIPAAAAPCRRAEATASLDVGELMRCPSQTPSGPKPFFCRSKNRRRTTRDRWSALLESSANRSTFRDHPPRPAP